MCGLTLHFHPIYPTLCLSLRHLNQIKVQILTKRLGDDLEQVVGEHRGSG